MSILQRILDGPIARPVLLLDGWSSETRSKVKQAFAAVKCDAHIENHWYFGRVMAIRPKDVGKFTEALAEQKLMTDSLVQGMVGVLKDDKTHYVRFACES